MRTNVIFFDLENTLINHWDDRTLAHEGRVRYFIDRQFEIFGETTKYGIFSYALWNENNVNDFISNIKGVIEDRYNISIADEYIITVDDIIKACEHFSPHGVSLTVEDIWAKFEPAVAFQLYCRYTYEVAYMQLLGNKVPHMTSHVLSLDLSIDTHDVWSYGDVYRRKE